MEQVRTAVVTGSARRVGRVIAERLVAEGWQVLVHATDQEPAELAAAEMGAVGGIGADLRDPGAPEAIVAATRELLGGELGLLVNNASTFVRARVLDTTDEQWHEAMDVNARAPLFLVRALFPKLKAGRGLVVNVSDRAAHEHWTHYAVHSASKAALESLTVTLARELHPDIRVNAIAPGTILPPDDASVEFVASKAAEGDMGTPQQLADVIMQLAGDPVRSGEIIPL